MYKCVCVCKCVCVIRGPTYINGRLNKASIEWIIVWSSFAVSHFV